MEPVLRAVRPTSREASRTVTQWGLHQPDGHDGPTEISSWVVSGRLAMGYYPGMLQKDKVAPAVFAELLDWGINQFVNLTQDGEGGEPMRT